MLQTKPPWLKKRISTDPAMQKVNRCLRAHQLETVCENAHCPNKFECFNSGTATFMILGDTCTRNCRFCAVNHGKPVMPDPDEPARLADAAKELSLKHVVITSVTRDDLEDGGLAQFLNTVTAIRNTLPETSIEILTPDFNGVPGVADAIAGNPPDVFNHNIETVPQFYDHIRPLADFSRSLDLLQQVGDKGIITKSSIMLGLGEKEEDVLEAIKKVKAAGVSIMVISQYLQPAMENIDVVEYITPERFKYYEDTAYSMGFDFVVSGPFVRSSYKAEEAYNKSKQKKARCL